MFRMLHLNLAYGTELIKPLGSRNISVSQMDAFHGISCIPVLARRVENGNLPLHSRETIVSKFLRVIEVPSMKFVAMLKSTIIGVNARGVEACVHDDC